MAGRNVGPPEPRITMAESLRRGTIKRAFEEMQAAYVAAFSAEPADEEKNAWANEKINALEATISEAIVMLTAGNAWTHSEERAVNELNEYVASIDRILEES